MFSALTLTPTTPVLAWISALDDALGDGAGALRNEAVVLDLSAARLHGPGLRALLHELESRGARVVGVCGIAAEALGPAPGALPPVLHVGDPSPAAPSVSAERATRPLAAGLLLEENVRSGQSVSFREGDVTVIGAVASGAEILAGGTIHIYGVLRGRAMAGLADPKARLFCRRFEGELLGVAGAVLTADDFPMALRGRPVRAWREGEGLRLEGME